VQDRILQPVKDKVVVKDKAVDAVRVRDAVWDKVVVKDKVVAWDRVVDAEPARAAVKVLVRLALKDNKILPQCKVKIPIARLFSAVTEGAPLLHRGGVDCSCADVVGTARVCVSKRLCRGKYVSFVGKILTVESCGHICSFEHYV
jgi:hypothetical protein